jgi:two-component system cell cycle sensor histidine kinase/response regulator CckA
MHRRVVAAGRRWRRAGRVPLRAYVAGLVVLFVAVAGVSIAYQRLASVHDARQAELASAGTEARTAARDIAAALSTVRVQVDAVAAQPAIGQAFGPAAAAGCTLQFGGAGEFSTGHLDLVRADGTVTCSSLRAAGRPGYQGARWLAAALKGSVLTGPVADARTGQQVLMVSAAVPGKGVVAAFLNLASLGPGLAAELGGARHLEFVVTNAGGAVVLTRSIQPAAWAGKPVAGTPFAGAAGQAEHRDLNGTSRLYGQALVTGTRWRVFAGASTAATFAAANALSDRQILITLAGLAVLFGPALLLYRGIARRELQARSRLAAVVESSADAIWGMTLDGVVTSWNTGAEHMFGYSRQEMAGTSVAGIALPEPILADTLGALRAGEPVVRTESSGERKDGTIIQLAYTISPIRDDGGAVTGAAAVASDVTEHNRAEADRRALEHRLRQSERLESLGQLASGITHDFNNLLAAIMNYAAFAEETTEKPEVRADIQQIQSAAERAARLTGQLLIFARAEPTQPLPLDLNAIVEEIHNLLSRSIGAHIELMVEPAAALPAIEADRGQLEQVLLNLAINARDAMPGGGTLTIKTGSAELDQAYADAHPGTRPGRHVELTVADTGTGMSAEVISRVFDPFFTTKPEGQGTGLGLSTVYGIIAGVGGSISVQSAEGAGTTFRLYFPAAAAAAAADPAAAHASAGDGQTILVVDDEPAVLAAAARVLRQNGYATLEAAGYDQAVALAASHQVQLLLTDSVMPRMSGVALAERITELKPGIPVLYMTGYSAVPAEGQPAKIQKPFTPQTLLEAVALALQTTQQPNSGWAAPGESRN